MLKAMIVEDEALERKALRYMIDTYYTGRVQLVAEAVNGQEAIEKTEIYHPDIVFMDISMPMMDGLEASTYLKDKYPSTEIIILTAYGHFDYAKEAIQIGINDYLLKPVSVEQFCEAMNKVIKKVEENRRVTQRMDVLRKQQLAFLPLLEKEMVMKIIYDADHLNDFMLDFVEVFDLHQKPYVCLIYKSAKATDKGENIANKIQKKLKFRFQQVICSMQLNETVCFIFDEDLVDKYSAEEMSLFYEELSMCILEKFEDAMLVGASDIREDMSHLAMSYKEAKDRLNREITEEAFGNYYDYSQEQQLLNSILKGDKKATDQVFEKLLDDILVGYKSGFTPAVKEEVIELIVSLHRNIMYLNGSDIQLVDTKKIKGSIRDMATLQDLNQFVKGLFSQTIDTIDQYKTDKSDQVIEVAKAYMQAHYKEPITLEEVAEHVDLSVHYFCKLFKKVEKMNYKDYMIQIKMEAAKKLLLKEHLSVKAVAYELGYSDPNYFSRAFKKYVGQSASEFTKLSEQQKM